MVDYLFTAALGFFLILMGFGKIPISENTLKNQEYLNKYGLILRVCGIILIVTGLILEISKVLGR